MQGKERDDRLRHLYDQVESNLKYVGATAIEDKLQDGVPESIRVLKEAGINLWMLTGDKLETALEIARSCALIDGRNTVEISMVADDRETLRQRIDAELKYMALKEMVAEDERVAIIVNGVTLQLIFQSASVTRDFFSLCRQSRCVVCCQLSPKQKSDIVEHYMKDGIGVCAAIGDGGNDAPMI